MKYHYFGAQLPFLQFGSKPPFTMEEFDRLAKQELDEAAYRAFAKVKLVPDLTETAATATVFDDYRKWEISLRTEIARQRVPKSSPELEKLPQASYYNEIPPGVAAAAGCKAVEREEKMNRLRWTKLTELAFNREFSLDYFCVYKLKLELLWKIRRWDADAGRKVFEDIVNVVDNYN